MRLFADTNIVAPAVHSLRNLGHDVVYSAERAVDPSDAVLLAEAFSDRRVFVTKDHDIGALVFRDGVQHCGVLLIDDLANVADETQLLLAALQSHGDALTGGAFVRAEADGVQSVRA